MLKGENSNHNLTSKEVLIVLMQLFQCKVYNDNKMGKNTNGGYITEKRIFSTRMTTQTFDN